ARIRLADVVSCIATGPAIALPLLAATWLMKSVRSPQDPGTGSCRAALNLASRLLVRPLSRFKELTKAAKSAICSGAPCTLTWNVAVAELPLKSVATHVTRVVPMANTLPDGGVHCTVGLGSTGSVAVAVKVNIAPAGLVAFSTVSEGTVNVGGTVSS